MPVKIRKNGAYLKPAPNCNAGVHMNVQHANEFAEEMKPILLILANKGALGPNRIATELNMMGVKSAMGRKWHSASVGRLLDRLGSSFLDQMKGAHSTKVQKNVTELLN